MPKDLEEIFSEGAACLSIGCNNAAAAMFRLCVDLATASLLPNPEDATQPQPNGVQRDKLFHRLKWLFESNILPSALHGLADCIREDGNDAAHVGNITKEDAEDLLDFTVELLERLFAEPKKLELAKERRVRRRQSE